MVTTQRAFVRTACGQIHVASAGEGFPVLLLHQTPRSWDEYRDVLPILGRRFHAIAMDTLGFGDSDALPEGEDSIERWAEAALSLLDALQIEQAAVVGHHTAPSSAWRSRPRRPAGWPRWSSRLVLWSMRSGEPVVPARQRSTTCRVAPAASTCWNSGGGASRRIRKATSIFWSDSWSTR
jgi:hypothetical protein